jgi:hypothetical protein
VYSKTGCFRFFQNILNFWDQRAGRYEILCGIINGLTGFLCKNLWGLYWSVDKLKLVEALSLHEPMELTACTFLRQMNSLCNLHVFTVRSYSVISLDLNLILWNKLKITCIGSEMKTMGRNFMFLTWLEVQRPRNCDLIPNICMTLHMKHPNKLWDSPSLLLYGYQEGWSGRGVKVTTNYHSVPLLNEQSCTPLHTQLWAQGHCR